jgi:hypothetical protein
MSTARLSKDLADKKANSVAAVAHLAAVASMMHALPVKRADEPVGRVGGSPEEGSSWDPSKHTRPTLTARKGAGRQGLVLPVATHWELVDRTKSFTKGSPQKVGQT